MTREVLFFSLPAPPFPTVGFIPSTPVMRMGNGNGFSRHSRKSTNSILYAYQGIAPGPEKNPKERRKSLTLKRQPEKFLDKQKPNPLSRSSGGEDSKKMIDKPDTEGNAPSGNLLLNVMSVAIPVAFILAVAAERMGIFTTLHDLDYKQIFEQVQLLKPFARKLHAYHILHVHR